MVHQMIFLGTGTSQGVPVIGCTCGVCTSPDPRDHRLRSSVLLTNRQHTIVVDTGPDFRQQMLTHKVQNLDAVVFTHEHKDHVAGLDDIRPFYFQRGTPFPVYATHRVLGELKQSFAYAFSQQPYPGAPSLDVREIEDYTPFQAGSIELMPVSVLHGDWPVTGFIWDGMAYITDAKTFPDETLERLRGLDVLVLNALRIRPHHSHLNLQEALDIIEELQPKKAYLIHISHLMGLHEAVSRELPDNVLMAYDGLTVNW